MGAVRKVVRSTQLLPTDLNNGRGERLGVPGFEGTLIFLALLQVPVVLFQRKPDMLD